MAAAWADVVLCVVLAGVLACVAMLGASLALAASKPANAAPNVRVLVINLARRPDRKQAMATKLASVGLLPLAEFVNAVDGSTLTPSLEEAKLLGLGSSPRKRGEIGCALSHLAIWRRIAAHHDPDTVWAVFEDDVTFRPQFVWTRDLAVSAPDVLRLLGYTTRTRAQPSPPEPGARPAPMDWATYQGGLFGYVLTRAMARVLTTYIAAMGMPDPVDALLRQLGPAAEHVGVVESLSAHTGPTVDSDIQREQPVEVPTAAGAAATPLPTHSAFSP